MAGKRTYIIAEAGINHNGSLENCYRMINAASDAGCDAVKFQYFTAGRLYPKSAGRLDWKDLRKKYSYDIYKAVEGFELPAVWIDGLMRHCVSKKIELLFSVFDVHGAAFLIKKGLKKIKLASCVVTNIPLIEYCAKTGLPVIMSTGGSTLGEVEEAVRIVMQYHRDIALLHCSAQYPTSLKDCNLGVLETMRRAFPNIRIGYSDHTIEASSAAVQAVYLGAGIIEKHMTLDKEMKGPDHFFALEPHELKRMVNDVRKAEKAVKKGKAPVDSLLYGSTAKTIGPGEQYIRDFSFSRLFAKKKIGKGDVINVSDIAVLRPGRKKHGLKPMYLRLFEKHRVISKKEIAVEEPITWDAILT